MARDPVRRVLIRRAPIRVERVVDGYRQLEEIDMKIWMDAVAAWGLAAGLAMAGAGCDTESADRREDAIEQARERLEAQRETYTEWAEGRAETEAAARGANEIEQELAGDGAEMRMDEAFDRHEDQLDEIQERLEDQADERDRAAGRN
jgi:hypothetical protein